MRKGDLLFLTIFISLLSIQFVSAATSIAEFLYFIDPDNVSFVVIFVISFTLIFFPLNRVFGRTSSAPAAIIALTMSFGITYAFFRTGLDITSWFSDLGISEGVLYNIVMIAVIIILLFLLYKFGIRRGIGFILLLLAGLLIIGALTDTIYEKGIAWIGAIIMALVALFLLGKKKDSLSDYSSQGVTPGYNPPPRGPGMYGRWRDKRRQYADMRHQQSLDYQRQRLAQQSNQKLQRVQQQQQQKETMKQQNQATIQQSKQRNMEKEQQEAQRRIQDQQRERIKQENAKREKIERERQLQQQREQQKAEKIKQQEVRSRAKNIANIRNQRLEAERKQKQARYNQLTNEYSNILRSTRNRNDPRLIAIQEELRRIRSS